MLYQVANAFNGMFGYIQDAKTVGTIFINGIANTLTTASQKALLDVELDGEALSPCHEWVADREGIQLPGLRYGQAIDTLYDVKDRLTKESKLQVTVSAVNKGKLEFPVSHEVEIQKC